MNMNNKKLSEKKVVKAVKTYFNQDNFNNFTINTECGIQFGASKCRKNGIADVVLKDVAGHWLAIVECKSEKVGYTEQGRGQLRSYLSATDTRFGILAASGNPDEWKYCENQRSNVFMEKKDKSYFEKHVFDPPRANRSDQTVINQLKIIIDQLKRKLKRVTIGLISALIIIAVVSIGFLFLRPTQTDTNYQVIRIIDGDTVEIKYKGKLTSVQLFGVNAPETVRSGKPPEPYGEEAAAYLQKILLDDSIYLRFDEHMWDQYERILGYVYRVSDGIFLNLEMIREGYARVDTRYPFKYEELFTDYESRARTDRKGLWSSSFR